MADGAALPSSRLPHRIRRYWPLGLLLLAALVLRTLWLTRLTGIDGDEAWYGVLAQQWLHGDLRLWRTPTGNYPGPFQVALSAIVQLALPNSFLALRLPSLFASLAAMALAWQVGRRHFDAATGRAALLLMAALPANIAYARFGWDPSYSGVIVLGGLLAALRGSLPLTLLAFALAVWSHPTNVFAAPVLALPYLFAVRPMSRPLLRAAVLLAGMAAAAAAMMSTATQSGQFAQVAPMLDRLLSPTHWAAFFILFARLVMGEPWFVHLAGTGYGRLLPLADIAGAFVIAGIVAGAVIAVRRDATSAAAGLLLGWCAMVVVYALVAGYAPLNAPTERYAFVLIAPTAMALAVALRVLLPPALPAPVAAATAAVLLLATLALYLVPMASRDSIRTRNFQTGPSEPKEAIARQVAALAGNGPTRIVVEDWFLYWPLRYRLNGRPILLVDADRHPEQAARPFAGQTYYATFAGSPFDRRLAALPLAYSATGYDGRPLINLRRTR